LTPAAPRAAVVGALACVCLAAAGCTGASPDDGIGARLRLAGAQYIPGALGSADMGDAPTIQTLSITNTVLFPGAAGVSLGGSATAATAMLIGFDGDVGHWVVPTGVEDPENPGAFLFSTSMSVSPEIPLGPQNLFLRGVDAHGNVGPVKTLVIKIQGRALSAAGTPPLQVTLTWDTEADLDLKVRVPIPNPVAMKSYLDVWNKSPVALPPLAAGAPPYTADDVAAAGQLDFDSNAQCLIDGRLQEDVVFPQAPPPGTYQVRVDAYSMCGQTAAEWHVYALLDGNMVAEAYGQAGDVDTQGSHGPGAGTLAFTFTVP
jgi:hypothetical protein